ncbi:hypothetical protein GCM10009799_15290 [Nocardiopsis rhodophaea]|uniref:ATP-binding protein n=1 Tax=Nocardiopsis rhodophaea TaxID=280238 RepID=A0ABN2SRH1_9ACTN
MPDFERSAAGFDRSIGTNARPLQQVANELVANAVRHSKVRQPSGADRTDPHYPAQISAEGKSPSPPHAPFNC